MKKSNYFLVLFAIVCASPLFAQDQTMGTKGDQVEKTVLSNSVLIVPFDERMYYSEFDREISEKDKLSFHQIRENFRKGIDTSLYLNLLPDHNVISMLGKDHDFDRDIDMIYAGIAYNYEALPLVEKNENQGKTKFQLNPHVKKTAADSKKDKIEQGQLTENIDTSEKFMATIITNDNLLNYLNKKYDAGYFVFITQLDIKRKPGTTAFQIQENEYFKEVRVHYTILNQKGERIAAGISLSEISSKENSLYSYLQKGINPVTAQIAELLSF
ncbi:MAG: hypothetical protein M3Q58_06885 [Bacteroidota bacterium]|nr:hypothetical protein [Bacteroidota bacterium]